MLKIKLIENRGEWENFVLSQNESLLVQSFKYADFYKKMGNKTWVLGIMNEEKIIGGSLVILIKARRGSFFFLPYGPYLPNDKKEEGLSLLIEYLKNLSKEEKSSFIRVSPYLENNDANRDLFQRLGFKEAPMHMLAETTCILDLQPSEDELLANMNKNHRNLIRRCLKEGAITKQCISDDCLKEFNDLLDITAKRHNFHRFSREFIEKEFDSFKIDNEVSVLKSILPSGELDSAALIYFYGNMAAYRHGASLNLNNKIPTSYLVQWNAILEAKKRGLRWYNFWGIAPANADKNHPFYGITHFKKGFGGFETDLLHCMDLPLNTEYWFNWTIETIRRYKRGF